MTAPGQPRTPRQRPDSLGRHDSALDAIRRIDMHGDDARERDTRVHVYHRNSDPRAVIHDKDCQNQIYHVRIPFLV